MLWFYVAAGITVTVTVIAALVARGDVHPGDPIFVAFVGTAFFTGLVAFALNLCFMNYDYETDEVLAPVNDLVSLADGTTTSGHISGGFFLVVGTIDSYPSYSYYARNSDGSYQLYLISDADTVYPNTIKVYEDTSTPRVECTVTRLKRGHSSNFYSVFGPAWDGGHDCDSYVFHVPPGSITHDFHLDAQ